jgi:hypothetical protein
MTDEVVAKAEEVRSNGLYRISGAAALMTGGLFAAAAISLSLSILEPDNRLSLLENNWLIVIFKLLAGFPGVRSSLLYGLSVLDILILVLLVITYAGLYVVLRGTSRLWSIVAFIQPVLGLVLFLITHLAGRSTVMGAELVISLVMMRSKFFDKRIAVMGILSALLLSAGDIGASLAPSMILAIFMGVGYVLLVSWLLLVGLRFFQFAQSK